MTRNERITVQIACKALVSGTDPGLVAQFLETVLVDAPEDLPVLEYLRPGGAQ